MRVVLASASPRRRALLETAGFEIVVRAADIDETQHDRETPTEMVLRLALAKASAVDGDGAVVVAADTTVALECVVFGKPSSDDDARRMLGALSGRTHDVVTGICVSIVVNGKRQNTAVSETTRVAFRTLGGADIESYLRTREHVDKAGAYGVQGSASVLIERVDGCITNVVGLPMPLLLRTFAQMGVHR
jgi:septum formation protein